MRYLIMKGSFPSVNLLPARLERQNAEADVLRLEQHRAERNKRAAEYLASTDKYRGGLFLHLPDNEPWSIKEIPDAP